MNTRSFTEFLNIRVTNDGYQVIVIRAKIEISKFFAGHTEKSLLAAEKWRDQVLNELPDKRLNPVPRHVLSALGLSKPVVGVFRHSTRKHYAVSYVEKGKRRSKAFAFGTRDEALAYAEAVAFRNASIRDSVGCSS